MDERASPFQRAAVRETAVMFLAAVGSLLFVYHRVFYDGQPVSMDPWAFALLTAVLYLFLRMLVMIGAMLYPQPQPDLVLCPECGRLYDESIPGRRTEHHRITLTPRPTKQEVLAAVMLRKAIDDARRSSRRSLAGPRVRLTEPPGDIENPPIDINEFERILRDLDFPDRKRRGPPDHGPKGPPEFPR